MYENFPLRRILVYGDSNTYGFDGDTFSRFGDDVRYPRVLEACLEGRATVIEEGLPGRTAVFDDPLEEGRCGLTYLTPCMLSHAPLDQLVVMLGSNDTKSYFSASSFVIASGIIRLCKTAMAVPAWRDNPHILVIAPPPMRQDYTRLAFSEVMGAGCWEKAQGLATPLRIMARQAGISFLDAASIAGMTLSAQDGLHLTASAHQALGQALAEILSQKWSEE